MRANRRPVQNAFSDTLCQTKNIELKTVLQLTAIDSPAMLTAPVGGGAGTPDAGPAARRCRRA
jgi:hypothetical protein